MVDSASLLERSHHHLDDNASIRLPPNHEILQDFTPVVQLLGAGYDSPVPLLEVEALH